MSTWCNPALFVMPGTVTVVTDCLLWLVAGRSLQHRGLALRLPAQRRMTRTTGSEQDSGVWPWNGLLCWVRARSCRPV